MQRARWEMGLLLRILPVLYIVWLSSGTLSAQPWGDVAEAAMQLSADLEQLPPDEREQVLADPHMLAELTAIAGPSLRPYEQLRNMTSGAVDGAQGSGSVGPDVIVGHLYEISRYGRVDTITAYSIGTISCNIGDEPVMWDEFTNAHPVIAQTPISTRTVDSNRLA